MNTDGYNGKQNTTYQCALGMSSVYAEAFVNSIANDLGCHSTTAEHERLDEYCI